MKVLVVEDDVMLADMLEQALLDSGHDVCGVVSNGPEAITLSRLTQPDVAILDMQVGDMLGSDIAQQLAETNDRRRMGILYVTGEPSHVRRVAAVGHAVLSKPYSMEALEIALTIVRAMATGAPAGRDLPYGMGLLH